MSEFVKGQWYTDGKQYWQYIKQGKDANGNTIHYIRLAGDVVEFAYNVDTLIPASLIPDFSKAEVGYMCFDVELETCVIDSIRKTEESIMLMVDDGKGNLNPHMINKEGYTHNPLLFNSFAQFQAYWAEQALLMATQRRNHE